MDHFEQIGINMLYDARNITEANRKFAFSCDCCCSKGRNKPCDNCRIADVHSMVVAFFNDQNKNQNHN